MKPIAKNKLNDPYGTRKKEKIPVVISTGKWREKYQCRRNKGFHTFVPSFTLYKIKDWKNREELTDDGWFVCIQVSKSIPDDKQRYSRWRWSSESFHPKEFSLLTLTKEQEFRWERRRDIHCSACGKIENEYEFSLDGENWTPDEWTEKKRKKFKINGTN